MTGGEHAYKGWMQTWLVHTRHPVRLARDLGLRGFLGFNLTSTGLILSSLVYPIYLGLLLISAVDPLRLWGDGGVLASMVIGLSLFNLAAGYMAMALLGHRALGLRGRAGEAGALVLLPVYWLMTSLASYRALFHLIARPHHWEKTPHSSWAVATNVRAPPATPPSRRSRFLARQ